MAERSTARAPYNFVPFSTKVLDYKQELPRHDRIDPSLKTGEIHVTMTAETPVFVSDGNKEPHFFRGANGKFVLPGSTVRGMTRENMEILGLGLFRPSEDLIRNKKVFFRTVVDNKAAGHLQKYYNAALGFDVGSSAEKRSSPPKVGSGYLCKEGDQYVIHPTKTPYLRISRNDPKIAQYQNESATVKRVAYTVSKGRVTQLVPEERTQPGMERGVLLFTGRPVGTLNPRYLFPEADQETEIQVLQEDILTYRTDFEGRKNTLKRQYDLSFWDLPRYGEKKPVFYLEHEKHVYFGMTLFPRISYQHSLPQEHCIERKDYPYAIMGYVGKTKSYRSRVCFGDFEIRGAQKEMPERKTVLGEPRPGYYPCYTVDAPHKDETDFQMRGYKQYWLKEANGVPPEKMNVASALRPLPKGTQFSGVIRFKNLSKEELGLLLWSLRLEEGCYQSIGQGKPYGFGRMKLSGDRLLEFDLPAMYTPENLSGRTADTTQQASAYIQAYCSCAEKQLDVKNLRDLDELQDFFYLRSAIRQGDEVSYMTLKEYQNVRAPLPDVASIRKQAQTQPRKK